MLTTQPIDQIHFSVDRQYETDIQIPGATLTKDDTRLFTTVFINFRHRCSRTRAA